MFRWLILPGALGLLALVGLALAADPEPEGGSGTAQAEPSPVDPSPIADNAGGSDAGSDSDDGGDEDGEDGEQLTPPSVTVTAEGSTIDLRFDPDGVVRASVVDDDTEFDLVPGTESGLRVTPDGGLELVPPGQIADDDLAFTPTMSGVEVHAPDNPAIELRPDGAGGGVSATEYTEGDGVGRSDEFTDDEGITLAPDDGIVVLNDGTTVSPIERPLDIVDVAPPGPLPWRWIFTAIAVLATISASVGYLLHRNREEADLQLDVVPVTSRVDENVDQFIVRLTGDSDPTRAIRLGFHAVEQGVGGLPARRDSETPFEWHRRVSDTIPGVEAPLGRICDLFAKARFAPGAATEDDRDRMVTALESLLIGANTPGPIVGTAGTDGNGNRGNVASGAGGDGDRSDELAAPA